MKPCTIDGCKKPVHSRGYCHMHYRRWRLGKDLLAPQQIASPGVPWQWLREHVDFHGGECLTWPFGRSSDGYARISSRRHKGDSSSTSAHIEMCRLAHGEPPSPTHQAAHSCGNGHLGCVHPDHLRWATAKENQHDRIEHGTHMFGELMPWAKLTEAAVLEIRSLPTTMTLDEIAPIYGVTRSTIHHVRTRKTWRHL